MLSSIIRIVLLKSLALTSLPSRMIKNLKWKCLIWNFKYRFHVLGTKP